MSGEARMVKVWGIGSGGRKRCRGCGAVYEVTVQRFPERENSSFNCLECGTEIDRWNSTAQPTFELIKPGKR